MIAPYYFVAATVLAVLPIVIIFRIFLEQLRSNPEDQKRISERFLMTVFIVEIIPIVLFVLGFSNLPTGLELSDLYVPGSIVILTALFGVVFVLLQGVDDVEVDTKMFRLISLSLMMSIPIMSCVGFAVMLS